MIADLKPYPAMKKSSVPPLGDVPEHWEVRRLRNLADMRVSNVDKHTKDGEQSVRLCNYVDVYKNDYIRPSMPLMRATATTDEIARFRLAPGDVLITKDSEAWNDIGVPALVIEAADDMISGYHLALLRPFAKCLTGGYLFRVLQSTGTAYQFHVEANGVTRYGLSHAAIKSVWLPMPPLEEQTAIVRFLDNADARIRRYIAAKQKLIKLLEEEMQAATQALVVNSFQENLPIDVMGRPREVRDKENWLCATVGHWMQRGWLEIQDGNHGELHPKADDYVDDGVPFLMANDIRSGGLNLVTCAKITEDQARGLRIGFAKPRDVLLTHKATIGQVGLVPDELPWPFLMLTPQVTYYRCKGERIDPLYLFAYMHTPQFKRQIAVLSLNQSTRNYIGILEQKNLVIPIPTPELQKRIVAEFESLSMKLGRAKRSALQEIELLREYRTRLIADIVTGKLDVREAAAKLPAPEALPLDEVDDVSQDKESAEVGELGAEEAA